jgi:hypothetical protein
MRAADYSGAARDNVLASEALVPDRRQAPPDMTQIKGKQWGSLDTAVKALVGGEVPCLELDCVAG